MDNKEELEINKIKKYIKLIFIGSEIESIIKDDKLASSCQSIGQYRKMLLDNIDKMENSK